MLGEARVTLCELPGDYADAVIRADLRPEFRDRIDHDLSRCSDARDAADRLRHILDASAEVEGFAAGKTFDDCWWTPWLRRAAVHVMV